MLLVDTGNSYQGLCNLIHARTHGEDGIYFTYEEDDPIAFNPFYVEDGVFDIEKKESIKTLILTLWKRDDEPPTRAEEVALSNAVNLFLEKIRQEKQPNPTFNTFYEFIRDEYQDILKQKRTREKDFDVFNFLNVLEPYYRGGRYDFLLNSTENIDLLGMAIAYQSLIRVINLFSEQSDGTTLEITSRVRSFAFCFNCIISETFSIRAFFCSSSLGIGSCNS